MLNISIPHVEALYDRSHFIFLFKKVKKNFREEYMYTL